MKVGLIRHFKVTRGYPNKIVTSNELMDWINEYDQSEVKEIEVDLRNIEWEKCFSSDMPRAQTTAEKCYNGNIIYMEELREIPLSPLFRSNLKLPLFVHLVFIRLAWLFNHRSQLEKKRDVINRINRVLDQALSSKENILIVGHGGVMMYMRRELLKRGFKGPNFKRPDNGVVYIFEK
ncbi:histidine phosphatase family protein [Neobacillus terrae]|uniref:histidine phosphatase family protein n=1 Tax=Neobacillus terrae TaxID=3034837 RepID=UPI00140A1034|nr:histidine phosphatase family protein [Neobacillus terrae]NHM30911.1 histidine phosphatase family protein [Neobacillus terrae]